MKMQLSGIILLLFLGVFCWGQGPIDPLPQGRDNPSIKADVTLVPVEVMVRSKDGDFVSSLQARDFVVYDNGVAQKIDLFSREETPLDVALIVAYDIEAQPYGVEIQNAITNVLQQLNPKSDRVALFCTASAWITGESFQMAGLTQDRLLLEHQIGKIPFKHTNSNPQTVAINGSIWEAALYLRTKGGPHRRRAIIVISDNNGEAIANELTLWDRVNDRPYSVRMQTCKDTHDEILKGNTTLYIIRIPIKRLTYDEIYILSKAQSRWWHQNSTSQIKHPLETLEELQSFKDFRNYLDESFAKIPHASITFEDFASLAKETGGDVLNAITASDLPKALNTAVLNLKHSYTLGFYPSDKGAEGSYHQIKVQLNSRADYSVQARTGYYVPKSAASAIAQKVQASDKQSLNANANDEYLSAMERYNFHSSLPRRIYDRNPDFGLNAPKSPLPAPTFIDRFLLHDKVDWVKGKLSNDGLKYGLKHIDFTAVAKSRANPKDKLNIDIKIDAAQLFFEFFNNQYRAFVHICILNKDNPISDVITSLASFPEEKFARVIQSKVTFSITMDPSKHKDLRVLVFQRSLMDGYISQSWGFQPVQMQP
jgi:VWFA-related protein